MGIREKIQSNVFHIINLLTGRLATLERRVMRLHEEVDRQLAIQRSHMVRIKNREEISDDFILRGKSYNDLSPEKAWKLFQQKDFDFIFLDVSFRDFEPEGHRPGVTIHIPLEQLERRWDEIPNHSTPIFIISEEGLRSVLACDYLATKGYFNCNNISGGWKFWPGHRLQDVSKREASA